MSPSALHRRALLSTTMAVAAAVGYGRRAYAACVNSGGSTYLCSGPNVTPQTITANNASVSTAPGFSVNTPAGNALTITGNGALSYTDTNASPLTAPAGAALDVQSVTNFIITPGSVTINTNGALSGGIYGILANNHGAGAVTITANGDVTGTSRGIGATNGGTDLRVTTGAGTTVTGGNRQGIAAYNYGTGAVTVTANGNVTSLSNIGIYARNYSGTALTVTTGPGTTVTGATNGIYGHNFSAGAALTITANGNVTGTSAVGILANTNGTSLGVTTAAGTTVSGGTTGIYAKNTGTGALTITANGNVTGGNSGINAGNYGPGALTITANGNVTGTTSSGIYAHNGGNGGATDLTVTTGAGTTVHGGTYGINARNYGTGAASLTVNGDATGGSNAGIFALNLGTGLSVTTGAGTTVSGTSGIFARNRGTGALTVTAYGNVTGTANNGIVANNDGTNLTVTTGAGTTVSGAVFGIAATNQNGSTTITANGNVTGAANSGINATNYGTNLTVTTGVGTTVSGAIFGIIASNQIGSTGAVTITVNGSVTGTSGNGIDARNSYGTGLTVTTGAGTTVSGGTNGIYAGNGGSGAIAITIAATSSVSGSSGFGIQAFGSPATVTVAGTVNGGAGGAVRFGQGSPFANRLELVTGAAINGNVLGGNGTDTLGLSGTGSGSFNVAQLVSFEAGDKTGSGSWTLTGINTGITAFSVGAGTLLVNGSLGNAAFAVNGGTLGGTGTVGNTLVNAGGTFAPGSGTPGTSMNVNGTLGFNAAATYAVNLNPATASSANVSGTATLGGATVNAIFAPGSYIQRQYTILTAGSVSGSFGALTNTNKPAIITDALSYDGTHAYLNLTLNFQTPAGLNGNQQAVANALTNFFNSTGGIPLVFGTLTPAGLTQLSGESATGSQQTTFDAMNQFMGLMTDPFIAGRGDPVSGGGSPNAYADESMAYAASRKGRSKSERDAYDTVYAKAPPIAPSFEQRWSVWASGFGGSQTTDGNAALGSNTATSRMAGTAVGADYRFSPFTIAGFALAGGGTSFSVNTLGSGRSDLFQAGAFIRHTVGPAYLSGALAYGWQDVTTDRTVTVAGIDRLRAQFNANAWSGRVEGGYRFVGYGFGITPYAAAQFTTFDLPAYAEGVVSGANTFALAYGARSVTDTRSELGLRTDKSFAMADGIVTLRGRLAWAHDFNPDRAIGATFQTLPGASFVVNGARQASDSALTTASAEMKWLNGWSAAATFEGEFSNVTRSYAGKGVVRYAW